MNAYASSNDVFSRRAVAYVDRVMVPEVRREAGGAARLLAVHLERLADRLHPLPERDGERDGEPAGKRGL